MINVTHTGQMIPASIDDDDELDVIDLTAFYGSHNGSFNFPLRPPTPFADSQPGPVVVSQRNEDHDTNAIVTWSLPAKQQRLSFRINNAGNFILSSSSQSLLSSSSIRRSNSKWRRTLNKLLKRTKSVERKEVFPPTASDFQHPYNFGLGEMTRTDSLTSRTSSNKRVHWFDDEEIVLNSCHRFVEYLKLLIQNILDDKHEKNHLENCQISLNALESLMNYQQIKQAFDDIMKLAKKRDKNQLLKQQTHIENLVSRNVLSSFA